MDALFWAVPGSLGVVAIAFAVRAFRASPPDPSGEVEVQLSPCGAGHYVCQGNRVMVTTGESTHEGGDPCVRKKLEACGHRCVAEGVTLAGVEARIAREQLCDPPERPAAYVTEEKSLLEMPVRSAGTCEGDGFGPTADGIEQCIMRSAKDPNALGVVVATAKCRFGAIPTLDRSPQLILRDQAIALWCRHDVVVEASAASSASAASATSIASGADSMAPDVETGAPSDARALDSSANDSADSRVDADR
ncbi:MAG: hypothetical protein NVS3B20_14820 [Polyangiales bacterium]